MTEKPAGRLSACENRTGRVDALPVLQDIVPGT